MSKNTIQEQFRAAAKYFEEVYKENVGRGFQARVSEQSKIRASYFNEILKGKKDGPEEVRRQLVEGITNVCNKAKDFTYEIFLDLGDYILEKNTADGWQPPDSVEDWPSLITPEYSPEKPKKDTFAVSEKHPIYKFSSRDKNDKNMLLIAGWINQQDEPGEYWTLLKMFLRREEPEFKDWLEKRLKKQSSGDNQDRLPESKSVVGE